jgi:class 3 adenylate cyclase
MSDAFQKALALSDHLESFSEPRDVYVLFIDLCDSTHFKQHCLDNSMPESVWIQRQLVFLSRTARMIERYTGTIVKTIGDEILATFDIATDPLSIVMCCAECFSMLANLKIYNKGIFIIKARASIDIGPCYNGHLVGPDSFDPIGSCVDRCARINKKVQAEQLGFSQDFFEALTDKNPGVTFASLVKAQESLVGLGVTEYYITELSKRKKV